MLCYHIRWWNKVVYINVTKQRFRLALTSAARRGTRRQIAVPSSAPRFLPVDQYARVLRLIDFHSRRRTSRSAVLFFSRPRSEGWPHHGRTFGIYLSSLSFWLTLSLGVLSTSWCCPSRPCASLPRVRAPGIVPFIISFSRQLPCPCLDVVRVRSLSRLCVVNITTTRYCSVL